MGWYTKVQMEFAYVKLIQKSGEKSKKSIQLLKDKKNVKKNHMNKTSIALLSVFLLASRAIELFEYLLLDTSYILELYQKIFSVEKPINNYLPEETLGTIGCSR